MFQSTDLVSLTGFLPQAETWQMRLVLVLVHFLWQGFLIAATLSAVVALLRVRSPRVRYAVSLLAFALMTIAPVATWFAIPITPRLSSTVGGNEARTKPSQPLLDPTVELRPTLTPTDDANGVQDRRRATMSDGNSGEPSLASAIGEKNAVGSTLPKTASDASLNDDAIKSVDRETVASTTNHPWLRAVAPWVLAVWLIGVAALSLRLLIGATVTWRWRWRVDPLTESLSRLVDRLCGSLGMRVPRVGLSGRVVEAVAIGLFRPMILLPVAWAASIPPDMLEAVLAHELAHIRRFDLWVNLLQGLVETVLFYHPAVWWLSRRLRYERELCCDELAVSVTQDRVRYAEMLEHVGRMRLTPTPAALAITMSGPRHTLLERVRHVLSLGTVDSSRGTSLFAAMLILLGVVCGSLFASRTMLADNEWSSKRVQQSWIGQDRHNAFFVHNGQSVAFVVVRLDPPGTDSSSSGVRLTSNERGGHVTQKHFTIRYELTSKQEPPERVTINGQSFQLSEGRVLVMGDKYKVTQLPIHGPEMVTKENVKQFVQDAVAQARKLMNANEPQDSAVASEPKPSQTDITSNNAAATAGTYRGRVVTEDGSPVPTPLKLMRRVSSEETRETPVDANGEFTFSTDPQKGSVRFAMTVAGFAPFDSFWIKLDQPLTLKLSRGAKVQIRLKPSAGNRLTGGSAALIVPWWDEDDQGTFAVDANGLATIPHCPKTTVKIDLLVPGYEEVRIHRLMREDVSLDVPIIPAKPTRLRVVSAKDGRPIEGAKVRLFSRTRAGSFLVPFQRWGDGPVWGESNADGRVDLTTLREIDPVPTNDAGTAIYAFRIDAPGYAPCYIGDVRAGSDLGEIQVGESLEVSGEIIRDSAKPERISLQVRQPTVAQGGRDGRGDWKTIEPTELAGKMSFHVKGLHAGPFDMFIVYSDASEPRNSVRGTISQLQFHGLLTGSSSNLLITSKSVTPGDKQLTARRESLIPIDEHPPSNVPDQISKQLVGGWVASKKADGSSAVIQETNPTHQPLLVWSSTAPVQHSMGHIEWRIFVFQDGTVFIPGRMNYEAGTHHKLPAAELDALKSLLDQHRDVFGKQVPKDLPQFAGWRHGHENLSYTKDGETKAFVKWYGLEQPPIAGEFDPRGSHQAIIDHLTRLMDDAACGGREARAKYREIANTALSAVLPKAKPFDDATWTNTVNEPDGTRIIRFANTDERTEVTLIQPAFGPIDVERVEHLGKRIAFDPSPIRAERVVRPGVGLNDWPQWCGSNDRNNVPLGTSIPTAWDFETGDNILWKIKHDRGSMTTPVIANGKVYIAGNNQSGAVSRHPKTEDLGCLRAHDAATGKLLWQATHPKLPKGKDGAFRDWPGIGICSPPTIEGSRLWYVSNRGDVVCLDTEGFRDGENDGPIADEAERDQTDADFIWQVDLVKDFGIEPHLVSASATLCVGNRLFVITSNGVGANHQAVVNPAAPSFVCLDKDTGKVLWTDNSPGGNILAGCWSSPCAFELNGETQVVMPGGDGWLYSFAPEGDGQGHAKLLWKFDANPKESVFSLNNTRRTRNSILATPVFYDGLVYVGVGANPEHGEGPGILWCIDPSQRGDVSPELAVDAKGDSVSARRVQAVIKENGERAIPNPKSAVVWCYKGSGPFKNGTFPFEMSMHRTLGNVAIKNGLLIVADFAGVVHCLDAKPANGQPVVHWTHDLFSAAWGTPLIVEGKVYVADEDGEVAIFALSKTKRVIAELACDSQSIQTTPVVANDTLYINTVNHLVAFKQKPVPGQNTSENAKNSSPQVNRGLPPQTLLTQPDGLVKDRPQTLPPNDLKAMADDLLKLLPQHWRHPHVEGQTIEMMPGMYAPSEQRPHVMLAFTEGKKRPKVRYEREDEKYEYLGETKFGHAHLFVSMKTIGNETLAVLTDSYFAWPEASEFLKAYLAGDAERYRRLKDQADDRDWSRNGWGPIRNGLRVRWGQTTKAKRGEPLNIGLEIYNFGTDPRTFDIRQAHPWRAWKLLDPDGNAVPLRVGDAITCDAGYTLKPSSSITLFGGTDLNRLFDIRQSGRWVLSFSGDAVRDLPDLAVLTVHPNDALPPAKDLVVVLHDEATQKRIDEFNAAEKAQGEFIKAKYAATVVPEKPAVMVGEPVWFRFKVANQTDTDKRVIVGGDYRNRLGREDSYKVDVFDDEGQRVVQPDIGFAAGGMSYPVALPAKKEAEFKLFLPHWATITKPGRYRFTVWREFDVVASEKDGGQDPFALKPEKITVAAESGFVVVAPNEAKFGELIEQLGPKLLGNTDESERANKMLQAIRVPLEWSRRAAAQLDAAGQETKGTEGTQATEGSLTGTGKSAHPTEGHVPDERVVPWFVRYLAQHSSSQHVTALHFLGQCRSETAYNAIVKAFDVTAADIKDTRNHEVAVSIAQGIHHSAIHALVTFATNHPNHPRATDKSFSLANHPYMGVRLTVLHFAATHKSPKAREIVNTMTSDKDQNLAAEARRYQKLLDDEAAKAKPDDISGDGVKDSGEPLAPRNDVADTGDARILIHYDIPGAETATNVFVEHAVRGGEAVSTVSTLQNGKTLERKGLTAGDYNIARSRNFEIARGERAVRSGAFLDYQRIKLEPGETKSINFKRSGAKVATGQVQGWKELGAEVLVALVCAKIPHDPRDFNGLELTIFDARNCAADGSFKTEPLSPGDYIVVVQGFEPLPREAQDRTGVFLPRFTGTAKLTVPATGDPKLVEVTLNEAKQPAKTTAERRSEATINQPVEVRLVGGAKQEPLSDVQVEFTLGYGSDEKVFGPFKTVADTVIEGATFQIDTKGMIPERFHIESYLGFVLNDAKVAAEQIDVRPPIWTQMTTVRASALRR